MSKDTFYFSHDYNARNDEKILELRSTYGAEGYGVFWMIVETMAENKNAGMNRLLVGGLSLSYGVAKDRLCHILEFCLSVGLFYEEGGVIFSKRLTSHKEARIEFHRERVESGRLGAQKRWLTHNGAIANDSKGKERKGNTEY